MKKNTFCFSVVTAVMFSAFTALFVMTANAQTPFTTKDSTDINHVKAVVLSHGDMWWDPAVGLSRCEFPKGTGKTVAFNGCLWIAGYDNNNVLHVAAQTYRQNGNDYWPGPLNSSDTVTYATSQNWAHFWKVNASDMVTFMAATPHTISNTPNAILTWPAKGNPYAAGNAGAALAITTDIAPFVDVNADGIYNPLDGDYPIMKGDQMVFWVFSDNGATHNESKGKALKAEVHATAFAFSRGTLIDNVVYYEYNVVNKSLNDYHNMRIGAYIDPDLGYFLDDYFAFDSTYRMGIDYNSSTYDSL
jgi:hypothetical protein